MLLSQFLEYTYFGLDKHFHLYSTMKIFSTSVFNIQTKIQWQIMLFLILKEQK